MHLSQAKFCKNLAFRAWAPQIYVIVKTTSGLAQLQLASVPASYSRVKTTSGVAALQLLGTVSITSAGRVQRVFLIT